MANTQVFNYIDGVENALLSICFGALIQTCSFYGYFFTFLMSRKAGIIFHKLILR